MKENWQTRLNNSERAKGFLGVIVVGLLSLPIHDIDRGAVALVLPALLRGHLFDTFGGFCFASLNKVFFGQQGWKLDSVTGFASGILQESAQGLGIWRGTFDLLDIAAFGIGSFSFGLFHLAAKSLYQSGVTRPIYRALKIQDSRLSSNYRLE